MNTGKKILGIVASVALAFGFINASTAPASADTAGGHNGFSVETFNIGDSVDIDYSCVTDNPAIVLETMGWQSSLTLPIGLSYDANTHHISGNPAEVWSAQLPYMECNVFDAATMHLQATVGIPAGSLVVLDPFIPPPPVNTNPGAVITLDPLNDAYCRFAMTLQFPSYWDVGTLNVKFSSGGSWVMVRDVDIDRLVGHWIVAPMNIEDLATDYPGDWSYSGERFSSNPACGQQMTVTVNYNVDGQPVETSNAWVRPTRGSNVLNAELYTQGAKCWVDIDFTLAQTPFDFDGYEGPTFIEIESIVSRAKVRLVFEETDLGDDGHAIVNLTDKQVITGNLNSHDLNLRNIIDDAYGTFSCGDPLQVTMLAAVRSGQEPFEQVDTFALPLVACGKGTFSADALGFQNYEVCPDAPIGSYVDTVGATAVKACPVGMTTLTSGSTTIKDCFYPAAECGKGTYSPSGHDLADAPCIDAPIGSYVSIKGAMVSTECPGSMTTEAPGAASVYDCFTPAPATIAKLKTPKAAKFGFALTLLGQTDQGTNLNITGSGACTVLPVPNGVGQKFKVTMGKKAGVCKLMVLSKPRGRFTGLTKTISIKVSKTGK